MMKEILDDLTSIQDRLLNLEESGCGKEINDCFMEARDKHDYKIEVLGGFIYVVIGEDCFYQSYCFIGETPAFKFEGFAAKSFDEFKNSIGSFSFAPNEHEFSKVQIISISMSTAPMSVFPHVLMHSFE